MIYWNECYRNKKCSFKLECKQCESKKMAGRKGYKDIKRRQILKLISSAFSVSKHPKLYLH